MFDQELLDVLRRLDSQLPDNKDAPERVPYPKLPMRRRLTKSQKWESLLWSIDSAQAHGTHALRGLAIALSQIISARALEDLVMDARQFHKSAGSASALLWDEALPVNAAGETRKSLTTKAARSLSVDLNDAIVFPAPWERWRLFKSLQNIGEKRAWGTWRQDSNHVGIAWKPWPIVWVYKGNHSTMAGLVRGGGRFKCQAAYDFSPVLKAVRTDGLNWFREDTGAVLGPVQSMPMAGIFEIGRRLLK
ncbi:DUF6710 family protein [Ideonella livida]|uniref:Uncharacterized protein n=1 Tax=Ideonella livida TaxID=2707176 RepID=A0A7C9TLS3_9BURK|nr:DUF6710 family protein [Ideonella livida]NDY93378.1 hypothetical protein [Ideonella livida]